MGILALNATTVVRMKYYYKLVSHKMTSGLIIAKLGRNILGIQPNTTNKNPEAKQYNRY